jgi:DNA-binding CsgD family transcriptional regulator
MQNKTICAHIICKNSLFRDIFYKNFNDILFKDDIKFNIYHKKYNNIVNIETDFAIFIDISDSYDELINEDIKKIPWLVLTEPKKISALSILDINEIIISLCPIDISFDELVNVIFLVCRRRKVFLDRFCLQNIGNHIDISSANIREDQLRLLGYLSEGLPNKVIAKREGCDESVVKFKVRSLLIKLGVSNRTQAAVKAVAMGLTPSGASPNMATVESAVGKIQTGLHFDVNQSPTFSQANISLSLNKITAPSSRLRTH